MSPWIVVFHVGIGAVIGCMALSLYYHRFGRESLLHKTIAFGMVLLAAATVTVGEIETRRINTATAQKLDCADKLADQNSRDLATTAKLVEALRHLMALPTSDRSAAQYALLDKELQQYVQALSTERPC